MSNSVRRSALRSAPRRLPALTARRIRCPLREDILLLQAQSLFLAFTAVRAGVLPRAAPPRSLMSARRRRRNLLAACHLLLHGFTFPTTSHIFILRGFSVNASRPMGCEQLRHSTVAHNCSRETACASGRFRRLALILWSLWNGPTRSRVLARCWLGSMRFL